MALTIVLATLVITTACGMWILAAIFGVFVALFLVHMIANLASPPSSDEVLTLLTAITDPQRQHELLNGDEHDDYSPWSAFCDTPIINNRRLNRIRVRCWEMANDPENRFFEPSDGRLRLTEVGAASIVALIQEFRSCSAGQASFRTWS